MAKEIKEHVMAKEIQEQVVQLSREKKQDKIVTYLKTQLNDGKTTAKDILDYARRYRFVNEKPIHFVICADTINKLGVVVYNKDKKLAGEFFKLAADRGSSWGNKNYAGQLLYDDPSEALVYADKAIKLALETKDYKAMQSAYFIKAQCHEKLGEYSEAMDAYSNITDKNHSCYIEAVNARARLIKMQISKKIPLEQIEQKPAAMLAPAASEVKVEEVREVLEVKLSLADAKPEGEPSSLIFHQGIPLPTKFGSKWEAKNKWLHLVDVKNINDEFEKRKDQLGKLITDKKKEITLIEEAKKEIKPPTNELDLRKQALKMELEKLQDVMKKLDEIHEKYSPDKRSVFRRHAAESRFFKPLRSKKAREMALLADEIIDQRYKVGESKLEPVVLQGRSTRLLISAERVFQEAVVDLTGVDNPKLGIPLTREKPWSIPYGPSGTTGYGPIESYRIGTTEVKSEHRTSPKRERLGDSFLPDLRSYSDDIYPLLSRLTNNESEKEKQLASFMIRYGKKHQPITLPELQTICENANEIDMHHFNQVCFLIMEKEQAQWHSATQESFHLGMSVSQARCLIMIEAGYLGFQDVFDKNSPFGVYSHTKIIDNPDSVAKSCDDIDKLYVMYLQAKHKELCKLSVKNPSSIWVPTREQAHLDLKQVYGGDSDTDEEGYETDLSI